MPTAKHCETIHARFEIIWKFLEDKVLHPDKYLKGIKQVNILEQTVTPVGLIVEREILFDDPTFENIKELIISDKVSGQVVYRLKDNPKFEGETVNVCRPTNVVYLSQLEYSLNWKLKDVAKQETDAEEEIGRKALQLAFEEMKAVSEKAEREQYPT
ncbi:unnamed protein product [Didymodactylos carnosus]|uniref:Uncharacterized protein n=1 Tax=Didymodactylos carnosus TaxID=1234261 RepID=A0A813W5Q0_9BILA|nr:unnamed protein product [Didymodactylos carnosus]CAF3637991.1 unnamed protein product [Didymodactylos carnosus]